MGIEPTRSAWKAEVLPLNYIRKLQFVISPLSDDNYFIKKNYCCQYLFEKYWIFTKKHNQSKYLCKLRIKVSVSCMQIGL